MSDITNNYNMSVSKKLVVKELARIITESIDGYYNQAHLAALEANRDMADGTNVKIKLIKALRENTDIGLKDGKDLIDAIYKAADSITTFQYGEKVYLPRHVSDEVPPKLTYLGKSYTDIT